MAAAAHAMAGDAAREQALRGRADAARAMIRDADRRASLAGRAARVARAALRRWTEAADGMPDGAVYPGGRAAWTGEQESMRADAERDRAGWSGRARRAAADVRAAGDYLRECADAADRAAAAAAKGENGGRTGRHARRAGCRGGVERGGCGRPERGQRVRVAGMTGRPADRTGGGRRRAATASRIRTAGRSLMPRAGRHRRRPQQQRQHRPHICGCGKAWRRTRALGAGPPVHH